MGKEKIHYDKDPWEDGAIYIKGDKRIGKMGICKMIWVKTTENVKEVTCKKCLNKMKKLRLLND